MSDWVIHVTKSKLANFTTNFDFQFRLSCYAPMSLVYFPNMTNEADKLLIMKRCKARLRRVPFQVRVVTMPSPVSSKPSGNAESKAGMSFRIRSLKKLSPSPVCSMVAGDGGGAEKTKLGELDVAVDLHKRFSQVGTLDEYGELGQRSFLKKTKTALDTADLLRDVLPATRDFLVPVILFRCLLQEV